MPSSAIAGSQVSSLAPHISLAKANHMAGPDVIGVKGIVPPWEGTMVILSNKVFRML